MNKTLTIREALELYPDLLNQPVIIASTNLDGTASLQFVGDNNYRTSNLSPLDKSNGITYLTINLPQSR